MGKVILGLTISLQNRFSLILLEGKYFIKKGNL